MRMLKSSTVTMNKRKCAGIKNIQIGGYRFVTAMYNNLLFGEEYPSKKNLHYFDKHKKYAVL